MAGSSPAMTLGVACKQCQPEIKPRFSNLSLVVPATCPIFQRGYYPEGEPMTILKQIPKLLAAFGLALALAGCGVNTIPTKDQAVKARWADVHAAHQRRNDLIPNPANPEAR